jgi:uncharacterized protein YodC (DUF2158 family)
MSLQRAPAASMRACRIAINLSEYYRRTYRYYDAAGESKMAFKPGDTVRLNSGGPVMTVTAVEGDWVVCDWFDGSKKCEHKFVITALTLDNSFEAQKPRW